jgi:hypothetical protein
MAEAIAAFSLAANVIQFIEFASHLTTSFWEFYKSASQTGDDGPDIETINADL